VADRDPADVLRENAYLKLRNAQLQSDILDLSAEVERLRGIQDRLHVRAMAPKPDRPAGGEPSSQGNVPGPGDSPSDAAARHAVGTKEAESIDGEAMAGYAIVRAPGDYFHVGGYRYTNLEDAVAQAKRQRSVVQANPQ
jgi:hypothetical protein